jgi:molybdopterin-containing oxidoreductase family iron-sulfur binding subunit
LDNAPEFREFLEAEFPTAEDPRGVSRRRWMQLMGASLALASVAGCRWEKRELLPADKRSPDRVPGVPQRFATAMDLAGVASGLLVTSFDGRPIKIEGNPKHPQNQGATDSFCQAAILQLYDPDRSDSPRRLSAEGVLQQSWDDFAGFAKPHFDDLRKRGGAGLPILAEASSSPTLAAQKARLLAEFPKAVWHEYEPISRDNERAGSHLAFGKEKTYRTQLAFEKAKVILCLDADPIGSHPAAVQYIRGFAQGRDAAGGTMNRLYAVEAGFSLTGAAADHRLPLPCSLIAELTARLEQEIAGRVAADSQTPSVLSAEAVKFTKAAAADLLAHRGQGIVMAGPRQPPEVHGLVHAINAALGNVGQTVSYTLEPDAGRPAHPEAIRALVTDMQAGRVETLLILGGNPLYDAPIDVAFAAALSKVATRIHLAPYYDETSAQCAWHLPQAHFLEAWGDARSYDGTYSIQQPLIEPLRQGKSSIELLAMLLGDPHPKAEQLVRQTFRQIAGEKDVDARWAKALHDGLLAESRGARQTPKLADRRRSSPHTSVPAPNSLELIFVPSAAAYDGRFANNGWLQETPEPMTRVTWDNCAILSIATAKSLGVIDNMVVRLKHAGRALELPAYVMPGVAENCVLVALGYGRTAAGQVGGQASEGIASVGANAYQLRTAAAMDFAVGATLEPTAESRTLAVTQDHQAIDTVGFEAREHRAGELVREATLAQYQKDPDFARQLVETPELGSLWDEHHFTGRRWGMSVDLSKCVGCGACMVACQAENNVPVVGRDRVLRGREMHWIRVDRYFRGDPQAPQAVHQPVACQQCELAPCEQVCPVAATVHSKEGLNDMVYNRCIGTRYCGNNCPYKVRRFNFFNYHKNLEEADNEILKMAYNPEVTVRMRGVMEKCTYCIQRIQTVKIHAKNEHREIADGEIRTACQQVCPAQAIAFGDLADPQSRVAKAQADSRAYGMLAEMNFRPRTMYLAKIRNPNPALET